MMWWGPGSGGWVSWVAMSLMMLAFWGGLVALIVWLLRGSGEPRDDRGDAESILDERFARGEIDAEELRTKRTALRERSQSRAA